MNFRLRHGFTSLLIVTIISILESHTLVSINPESALAQGGAGTRLYLPIIMKFPYPAKSHYMNTSEWDFDPYTIGQADAQEHQPVIQSGQQLIVVLAWGQPCKYSSTIWGAYAYDATCHQLSELQTYIQEYLDGYCARMQSLRPGGSGQYCGYRYNVTAVPVIIVLGVDNCIGGPGCSNPDNASSNAVTYEHGQAWGTVVQSVGTFVANRGYSYQIFITGAMDIEGAWNTYTNTKAWLDGYKTTSSRNFYDYGDCNCPEGYSPGNNDYIGPPLFRRDWSYNRIHEVSYRGIPIKYPLPQIYHTDGSDARKWQGLSKWAVVNGYGKMIFRELLTEAGACAQGLSCTGIDNGPMQAILQVQQALNADSQTAGGLSTSVRSADINWYPRP